MNNTWNRVCLSLASTLFIGPSAFAQAIDDQCFLCEEAAAVIEEYSLRESSTPVRELEGWAPPNRIVIGFGGGGRVADLLKRAAPDAEIIDAGSPEAAAEFIAEAKSLLLPLPELCNILIGIILEFHATPQTPIPLSPSAAAIPATCVP